MREEISSGNGMDLKNMYIGVLVMWVGVLIIEGNTSNKCAERMYSFDDVQVMGYGSPKYE